MSRPLVPDNNNVPGAEGSKFLRDTVLSMLRTAIDSDERRAVVAIIRRSRILNKLHVEHAADVILTLGEVCGADLWFAREMAALEKEGSVFN